MKRGKKRNPTTSSVWGTKEKLSKRSDSYVLSIRHSFQLDHIAISSGSSEAFRFCAFYITFHFYMYKGLRGNGAVVY